jgi:hypothetical protein
MEMEMNNGEFLPYVIGSAKEGRPLTGKRPSSSFAAITKRNHFRSRANSGFRIAD